MWFMAYAYENHNFDFTDSIKEIVGSTEKNHPPSRLIVDRLLWVEKHRKC